ncbi:MAG: MFS transporter [Clostridiales bacterium]|jgi:MFS family permease|nr:MFS transporter [Eubacteriales bacterium]MDH7566973.1 MFS transporter [Clostridiales bacterium]
MKNNLLTKITVVLLTFALMGDMVVIPAAGGIFTTFYDANPALLNFILTGPMLISVAASFLCGFLARTISKKYLLIGGYVLFIVAACGGALIDNIYYVVTMRAIAGFTYGIVGTAATGLIAEIFLDEKVRSFMMGAYNAAMSAVGVILSLISGFLAVGNWHNSFYIYLAAIPILIMAIAFLPKTPPEGKASADASANTDRLPLGKFLPVAAAFLLLSALYYIVVYFIAIYVEEMKLGDASTAGIFGSASTVGSFVACMLFSVIYMRLKRATPIVVFLVMAAAYIVMAFPSNIWVVGIMCLLSGAAYGLGMSYYFMHSSMIVPAGVMSLAMGIINAVIGLGGFFSSYALELYKGVFHAETMAPTFMYIGITLAIGGILSIILTIRAGKNPVNVENTNA